MESLYLPQILPNALGIFLYSYLGFDPLYVLMATAVTPLLVPIIKTFLIPTHKYPLRNFNPKKLEKIISQYLSYYSFDYDARFYPTQSLHEQTIAYNLAQLNFLYKFYDSRLNSDELTQILKDESNEIHAENIVLNNSAILDRYKVMPGAGREIGNLPFIEKAELKEESGAQSSTEIEAVRSIFPTKFDLILNTIKTSSGPVVVYTHYYANGLLLFKQYLDRSEYRGQYRIFDPDQPKATHSQIVNEFNSNKIKILLLHPEITEGISLTGTRQLHFLEIPISSAVQRQIIGRTVRYRSHLHLPKGEQHVDVYLWKYGLSMLDLNSNAMLRKNWHHNFAELNYYSDFGKGRRQIDKNADLKAESPDERAYGHLNTLNLHVDTFREYVKIFSIENALYYDSQ